MLSTAASYAPPFFLLEWKGVNFSDFVGTLSNRITCDFSGVLTHCRGDVAGGSFLVFCWFLLVRNVARLLLWSCVWLVFGEDLGLLVERNVAPVWVCGVCCERKFAPAW